MSKAKFIYVGVVLLIVIAATAYQMYPSPAAELTQTTAKSFASSKFGITFLYPSHYNLDEANVGPEAPVHQHITLRKNPLSGGEAGPEISVDIYENDGQYASAQNFIDENPESNIKLATSDVVSRSVGASETGLTYQSTGLYESRTVVIARTGYVYMLRVAGAQEEAGLDADFERILDTVVITDIKKID